MQQAGRIPPPRQHLRRRSPRRTLCSAPDQPQRRACAGRAVGRRRQCRQRRDRHPIADPATCCRPGRSADITGWRKSRRRGRRVLLHRPARFVRRAHRPARTRRCDRRGPCFASACRCRRPRPFEPVPYSSGRGDGAAVARSNSPKGRATSDSSAANETPGVLGSSAYLGTAASSRRCVGIARGEARHGPRRTRAFADRSHLVRTCQRHSPAEIVQLRYDSHANLVASGRHALATRRARDPFPGFVPDPPTAWNVMPR